MKGGKGWSNERLGPVRPLFWGKLDVPSLKPFIFSERTKATQNKQHCHHLTALVHKDRKDWDAHELGTPDPGGD